MERYLLFDAGCAVCNQIAAAIEEAAAGKLKALSLRDPRAREWLEQAYPAGWAHQPYLVTVDGERVRASAGTGMALRLGWLLGPRQAWRVWNLARQYGVGWPAGEEFSAERRGFMKRAALFVGSLFFFPRFGSAGGQGQSQGRPRHPFEGIRIKNSRKLKGAERAAAVQRALNSQDVRNVLEETAATLDAAEAGAARHELEGGNTLLAVGFRTNQGALAYYQLAQPIDHYATWAWLYVVEDETTARLVSISVNGSSVQPNAVECPICEGLFPCYNVGPGIVCYNGSKYYCASRHECWSSCLVWEVYAVSNCSQISGSCEQMLYVCWL